jgi:hypothetical protein
MTTFIIALVTIASSFLIAHWHRKQMQQNERFRLDPTAGLTPPPSPPWAFIKSNKVFSVTIGFAVLNVIALVWVNTYHPYPAWLLAFAISWQIGNVLFGFVQYQLQGIYKMVRTNYKEQTDIDRMIIELVEKNAESLLKIIGTQVEANGASSGSILGMIADLSNGMRTSTVELVKAIETLAKYTMPPPASTRAPIEPPLAQ